MLRSLLFSLCIGFLPSLSPLPLGRGLLASTTLSVSPPSILEHELSPSHISASGAILFDAQSGEVLFSKEPDTPRPMASLTKLMTAIVVAEETQDFNLLATVPMIAEDISGSTVDFSPGQHISINALLASLLIASANDAAYTLALRDGHHIKDFVAKMNARSTTLGLMSTHFTNPAGLDGLEHYSTPREVGWLAFAAWRKPLLRSLLSSPSAVVQSREGERRSLRNTNELLHKDSRILGGKTGTTNKAGECLTLFFELEGREYLLVLLGSSSRYTDASHIMDAIVAMRS